ncbi:PQQ-binding-like beta-propeller repeat protein [Streptomyces sp. ISL-1]|uniref:serine/threonine-protein kinase n=1 Tax=Streptomyces sp. ISL-1 TaxID=2817657 RepID=UPI001BE8845B|nr:serine/threonine-protein kinase [Streptomyces sp. ISL-1]MBT2394299.1 PQQ-binding-like beta-propeller repeat protein [Streptomyces sp. ISL-1]
MPPLRSTGRFPEAEHPEYAGQYRLEACLGNGGMGVVHLATSASGLRLAVKVIHAEHASDPEFRARFRQEVAAARKVSGAFTAPVVDADPEAERPWMATLFIDGPTLAERVKRNGPLGSEELRKAGAGLAEALRDIHRAGVVHRDLKPSNVMLAADGPKVIDFGISRPADSDLRTETGKLIGTPPFMAPEQFQRPREVGPAADVFAMGAVLVHAATGRGPFDSDSPYIVAYQVVHNEPDLAGVPADLVPLFRLCLAKDPADRPTPYELMVALRGSSPSSSYDTQAYIPAQHTPDSRESAPLGPAAGSRKWTRRKILRACAALAVLVTAGIAVSVVSTVGDGGTPAPAPAGPRAEQAFRPWSVPLRGGDDENRTPVCASAGPGLYCTAPGIKAARLNPADGKTFWSVKSDDSTAQTDEGMTPVLAGGLLQVVAPGGNRLEALDPESGRVRWDIDISRYSTVRPAGDAVLLVTDGGLVRAVDAATGKQRWTRQRGGTGTQWLASPGGDRSALAVTPSTDGTSTLVSAVDPADGALLWDKRVKGTLSPAGRAGGFLYLLSANADGFTDAVVRLDTAGKPRAVRRIALPAPVDQAQAAVAGDTVYLSGAGGSLLALDTGGTKPAQLWRLETSVTHLSRPAADARAVYVTAGDGRLLAVDAVRGVLVGQTEPRMDDGRYTFASVLPAPVAAGDKVFGSAPDGSVFALDARDPAKW